MFYWHRDHFQNILIHILLQYNNHHSDRSCFQNLHNHGHKVYYSLHYTNPKLTKLEIIFITKTNASPFFYLWRNIPCNSIPISNVRVYKSFYTIFYVKKEKITSLKNRLIKLPSYDNKQAYKVLRNSNLKCRRLCEYKFID